MAKMQYFLSESINEAEKSNMKNQYGCLLIYRGDIISRGHNYHNYHNKTSMKSPSIKKSPLCS